MFATILKNLREEFEMTQEQVGKLLNITKQAIYSYEKGENEPTIDAIVKIADVFNVSVDYLLGRTKQRENLYIKNELLLEAINDKYKKRILIDVCKSLDNYNLVVK
ncbi:helix-turn-helix transcriptional regulator [uncultured Clostridium sp.]|uniref:helix-turn-helix domain-containing protein n=1 Tax=uncultured Clostridium sp. TaxID=59620 RepID=UPI0028EFED2F|nr:helix-turn-helix transcriptional regulator [uncultured Clostridium sp.]